jgi:hypothetical protein
MGGNSLKRFPVGRIDKETFLKTVEQIKKTFKGVKLDVIPAYREKETFGDLDVIVEMESMKEFYTNNTNGDMKDGFSEFLNKELNSRQEHFAFPVISFEYRENKEDRVGFQVDFIHIPKKNYDFSLHYLSYNDLGNLIGVIYRHMGLRFGHYGVNKEVYSPTLRTTKLGEINITNDFEKALMFIGLDPKVFNNGFDNMNQIFEYISTSKFFNPEIYALETGINDYKSRRRNAQRSTYSGFLNWIKENEKNLNRFDFKNANKKDIIDDFFKNDYKIKYQSIIDDFEEKVIAKDRIKGETLSLWTGLTHQALGLLSSTFKGRFENEDQLITYIKSNTDEKIKKDFIELKKTLNFKGMIGDPETNPAPIDIKHKEKMRIKREKQNNMR